MSWGGLITDLLSPFLQGYVGLVCVSLMMALMVHTESGCIQVRGQGVIVIGQVRKREHLMGLHQCHIGTPLRP